MNHKKICFIICTNKENYFKECCFYLEQLIIPIGMECDIVSIRDAKSMTQAYNEAMRGSDAKYKVYLHQDVFILNRHFIDDILRIFENMPKVGMIGMVGPKQIPETCIMWNSILYGNLYKEGAEIVDYNEYKFDFAKDGIIDVVAIDGLLMATQYDILWREDIFDGWDFYDASQCAEFKKEGYQIVVPKQRAPWCVHDAGNVTKMWNYNTYRKKYMEEYKNKIMTYTTIVIVAYNSLERVQVCIKTLTVFNDLKQIKIIIADNASTDGLKEWVESQDNINYLRISDNVQGYGRVLNEVICKGDISGNVMFMTSHYAFTPNCIKLLNDTLEEDNVGIAVPVSDGFYNYQQPLKEINSLEQAIEYANSQGDIFIEERLQVYPEVIMIKEDAFKTVSKFSDNLIKIEETIVDYCLELISHNYSLKCCYNAILFDVGNLYSEMEVYSNLEGADSDKDKMNQKWGMKYFNGSWNNRLINYIDAKEDDDITVLEIGCDCGGNLLGVKNKYKNAFVHGVEINPKAAIIANHLVGNVLMTNIEDENLPYKDNMFDYIIFGDVLEHLHDPEKVLVYCKKLLKKDGKIIANIPNVMHISVISELLNGNFTYQDLGLLDNTHIHMFTYNEIIRTFQQAGYVLDNMLIFTPENSQKEKELIDKLMEMPIAAERFMFETFQYTVRAKINDEHLSEK